MNKQNVKFCDLFMNTYESYRLWLAASKTSFGSAGSYWETLNCKLLAMAPYIGLLHQNIV